MKKKIAFVVQPEYVRHMYEKDLDDLYDILEFENRMNMNIDYYNSLISFDAEINFFTMANQIPREVFTKLKGKNVFISTEPMPKYSNNKLVSSMDMYRRFFAIDVLKTYHNIDYFFHYEPSSISFLRKNNFNVQKVFYLPMATGTYKPANIQKDWDIFFIGRSTTYREQFLWKLKHYYNVLHIAHGIVGEELVRFINRSKIAINLHHENKISFEPRMQLYMACKILVMSEPLSPNDLFIKNEHYVEFSSPRDLFNKVKYYLENEDERLRIAENGYKLVTEKLSSVKVFPELIDNILTKKLQALTSVKIFKENSCKSLYFNWLSKFKYFAFIIYERLFLVIYNLIRSIIKILLIKILKKDKESYEN